MTYALTFRRNVPMQSLYGLLTYINTSDKKTMVYSVDDLKETISIKDFCNKFGVSRGHYYNLRKNDEIRIIKTGKRVLILLDSVNRWREKYKK